MHERADQTRPTEKIGVIRLRNEQPRRRRPMNIDKRHPSQRRAAVESIRAENRLRRRRRRPQRAGARGAEQRTDDVRSVSFAVGVVAARAEPIGPDFVVTGVRRQTISFEGTAGVDDEGDRRVVCEVTMPLADAGVAHCNDLPFTANAGGPERRAFLVSTPADVGERRAVWRISLIETRLPEIEKAHAARRFDRADRREM